MSPSSYDESGRVRSDLLALVERDGKRVITPATGLVKPGCRLERLQHDLPTMRDRYGRGDNTSASDVGGGPGMAASERGQATPADGAASPATIPPEAWAPPPNPDFSTARTVLVPPRPGDLAAPRNLNTTVVKRDEQAIMVVVALVAAAFAVWSYLTESYWLTMLCAAGVLFYV